MPCLFAQNLCVILFKREGAYAVKSFSLQKSFKKIINDARTYRRTFLYTVFCFFWLNIMIQGPGFLRAVPIGGVAFPPWIGPVLFCAATYLFFGLRQNLLQALSSPVRHAVTLEIACLGGLLFYYIALLVDTLMPWGHLLFYGTGSFFIGFAAAFMLIELAQIFGDHAPKQVLSLSIAAVFVSAFLVFGYFLLPLWFRIVLLVLLCIGAGFLDRNEVSEHNKHPKTNQVHDEEGSQTTPLRFMALALPLGFSNGVLANNFLAMDQITAAYVDVVAFLVAGIAIAIFAIMFELDFNQLIYQVGLPLTALGALAIGIFPEFGGTGYVFVQFSGFLFTYFVVWGLCAMLIRYLHQSAIWTVSYSTACLMFGQFLGGIPICLCSALLPPWSLGLVSYITVAALFMVTVLNAGHKSFHEGWGTAKPASSAVEISRSFQETVERMAVMAGLTSREREVFLILAQGRGRQFVQRELVISDNTAKVHIRNVYKKLGVHSMQELAQAIRKNAEQTVEDTV